MTSRFFKNVTIVSLGSVVAQTVTVLAAPILSRLFSPEQFGEYALFITIVGLLSTVSAASYELAIVKQSDEADANYLFQTCIALSLTTSILLFLLLPTFNLFVDLPFAALMPITIFLYAANNALYSLLNRFERYTLLAKTQASRSSMIVFVQIFVGYLGFTRYGLTFGVLFSAFVVFIFSYFSFSRLHQIKDFVSIKKSKTLLRTNSDFAVYGVPQNTASYIGAHAPLFVLTMYFDLAVVGAYFLAVKLVQVPANVLGAAVKRVFYRRAEVLKSDLQSLLQLYDKMTLMMTVIIVPVTVFWFFNAETIFPLVFGEEWDTAATISKWLLIWFGAQFVMAPTRSLFIVFDMQRNLLGLDTVLVFLRVGLLIGLAQNLVALEVVKYYSIVSAVISVSFVIGWHFFLVSKQKLALE